MFHYAVFGLTVASELPLPELRESLPGAADVVVRRGAIAPQEGEVPGLRVEGERARLLIPDVGRYLMERGAEMTVEPAPAASERNVRLYLLGSAFAAILHQRGLLPLHANAIVIDGRAVAFMGHPGAGKSTMAAWFHDAGFPVLADDVCIVAAGAEGPPVAHRGIPRLRLWREALEASGRQAGDYEMSFDDMDKYNVPTHGAEAPETAPLSHVYVLEKARDGAEAGVERLRGSAAVEALVANTYRGAYVPLMGLTGRHLIACSMLARQVPVFRARRVWGLDALDSEALRLETHARGIIAGGAGR